MNAQIETSAYIALVGLPGSGKTHAARILDSLLPHDINPDFGDVFKGIHAVPMRSLLTWHGYEGEADRAAWSDYHNKIRQQGRGHEIFQPLSILERHIVVVDAVRHEDDVAFFKSMGGMILAFDAPEALCRERFTDDPFDEKHTANEKRFQKLLELIAERGEDDNRAIDASQIDERLRFIAWELARDEVYESGIYSSIQRADATIDASVGSSEVISQARLAISEFIVSRQAAGFLVDGPSEEDFRKTDSQLASSARP